MNTVQNEPPNWRERAERAEAERDAVAVANCPRLCMEFCNEFQTHEALRRAEAERDTLVKQIAAIRETFHSDTSLWAYRAIAAERDALRALLAEAQNEIIPGTKLDERISAALRERS